MSPACGSWGKADTMHSIRQCQGARMLPQREPCHIVSEGEIRQTKQQVLMQAYRP